MPQEMRGIRRKTPEKMRTKKKKPIKQKPVFSGFPEVTDKEKIIREIRFYAKKNSVGARTVYYLRLKQLLRLLEAEKLFFAENLSPKVYNKFYERLLELDELVYAVKRGEVTSETMEFAFGYPEGIVRVQEKIRKLLGKTAWRPKKKTTK
ncbi:MAG: hypothetical protein Q7S21_04815 [archaeon]|nr:hypothetical protein [archaeon]